MTEQPNADEVRELRDLRTQLRSRATHLAPTCRIHQEDIGLGLDLALTRKLTLTLMRRSGEWSYVLRRAGTFGTATSLPTTFEVRYDLAGAVLELVANELRDHLTDLIYARSSSNHSDDESDQQEIDEALRQLHRLALPHVN